MPYYVRVARFMPRVEIIQKHNMTIRRLYIQGDNGKVTSFKYYRDNRQLSLRYIRILYSTTHKSTPVEERNEFCNCLGFSTIVYAKRRSVGAGVKQTIIVTLDRRPVNVISCSLFRKWYHYLLRWDSWRTTHQRYRWQIYSNRYSREKQGNLSWYQRLVFSISGAGMGLSHISVLRETRWVPS